MMNKTDYITILYYVPGYNNIAQLYNIPIAAQFFYLPK